MRNILLLIFILKCIYIKGQNHDNIWHLGYYYTPPAVYPFLDFSSGIPDTLTSARTMSFFITCSSMSDSSGNLLFYSNGQWIANKQHDTLSNSMNFNPGYGNTIYNRGLGFSQACISIPKSRDSNEYYLIYEQGEYFINQDSVADVEPYSLRYAIIDMDLDSGNGGIANNSLNSVAINDTLLLGRITACKHANGRDWWIVVHKYYSDKYYIVLFTENGIASVQFQHIGPILNAKVNGVDYDIGGMSSFSPDGSKYAMIGTDNILHLMEFDRCNGILSNYQSISISNSLQSIGCSWSPNSRFIYTNTLETVHQFDTYASNIASSEIIIAVYDNFSGPFNTLFFLNQLGPDGKIYLSTYGGCYYLHVIDNPDSLGLACNFLQHAFELPDDYGGNGAIPNFPNYRLGPVIGSVCDSLTSLSVFNDAKFNLKLYPNPTNGKFQITYNLPSNNPGILHIMDVSGKTVFTKALPQWSVLQNIELSQSLESGLYNCIIKSSNYLQSNKFLLIRQ